MKNPTALYLCGIITIISGIGVFLIGAYNVSTLKYFLSISILLAGFLALVTALSLRKKQVPFAYHGIHAFALITYALILMFTASNNEFIIFLTAFLFIFYAVSEIIFCASVFNIQSKVNYQMLMIRISLGLLVGIATAFVMTYTLINMEIQLIVYSIIFILIGVNVLLYKPILSKPVLAENS